MKSRFHEDAEIELDEAVAYYDRKAFELGGRLLAEVKAATVLIEDYPEIAPEIDLGIRGKVLTRFPHILLYALSETEVLVLAVAHQSQDPEKWKEIVQGRRPGA